MLSRGPMDKQKRGKKWRLKMRSTKKVKRSDSFFLLQVPTSGPGQGRLRERLRKGQGKVKVKARSKGLVYSTVLNTPSAAISVYMKRPAKHWLRIL
jgi:hypothetical protein